MKSRFFGRDGSAMVFFSPAVLPFTVNVCSLMAKPSANGKCITVQKGTRLHHLLAGCLNLCDLHILIPCGNDEPHLAVGGDNRPCGRICSTLRTMNCTDLVDRAI